MRYAVFPLLVSSALHLLGFVLSGFATSSVFLLFPAALYVLLSAGLARGLAWVAWLTLVCMLGGIAGTLIEVWGQPMAPVWVLGLIVVADLVTGAFLARALWLKHRSRLS